MHIIAHMEILLNRGKPVNDNTSPMTAASSYNTLRQYIITTGLATLGDLWGVINHDLLRFSELCFLQIKGLQYP